GESVDHLLRRFSRRALSSVIRPVKANKFHTKPQTKNSKKRSATHRAKTATRLDWLDKVGKLDEYLEKQRGHKRRR
ncbi:MAG: 30S ribosomal protein S21, partial [Candidatus Jacksonbacteria bacterium]|nr:30S ribosomal protein S21 [Candidatus Jacksonbacteria bacterium]MBT7338237.1 30S ribosomal protein S21 [Candidatus Jacksonbacteria bacterium]